MRRLRVLISSHEFSPYQGSECALGWNIVTRLAQYHDVTLLCAEGPPSGPVAYREQFKKYSEENAPIEGLTVFFVPQPDKTLRYHTINQKLMKLTKGFGWTPLFYLGLNAWHKEVLSVANTLGYDNFDIAHQLTPISFLRPGFLWQTGIPFFWGPIGGMYKVPLTFALSTGPKSLIFEIIRTINIKLSIISSNLNKIVKKSQLIWVVSPDESSIINKISTNICEQLTESAAPHQIKGFIREFTSDRPLVITWSGTHEPRKALPLLLNALTLFSDKEKSKIHLHILGEGSETDKWKNLAKNLKLENLKWHGRLPYPEALKKMEHSDIFILTSFREATSHVILEAMAWGMPVICHDACGMAIAVTDSCGLKVPLINPEESVKGFYTNIKKLLDNPELITILSKGSLERSKELSWDAKVKTISDAYLKFYSQSNEK